MKPEIDFAPNATDAHPQLTLTPWTTGTPERVGWYVASAEQNDDARRYHDGEQWSDWCHADASEDDHDRARATPARTQSGIEYRGLTEMHAAWLTAEMEREPRPCGS